MRLIKDNDLRPLLHHHVQETLDEQNYICKFFEKLF